MQVTIHQARTQLSKRITAAERGEEVIIARRDKAVVQLNPVRELRTSSSVLPMFKSDILSLNDAEPLSP